MPRSDIARYKTEHNTKRRKLKLCSDYKHDDVIKWKHFPRYWPLCGEFTGPGEFPAQRPVTRCFDVFFDLRLNKRLSKQWWGWWFETPSWSLWRHRNTHKNTLWLVIGKAFGFTPLSFSNIYGLRITKPQCQTRHRFLQGTGDALPLR